MAGTPQCTAGTPPVYRAALCGDCIDSVTLMSCQAFACVFSLSSFLITLFLEEMVDSLVEKK